MQLRDYQIEVLDHLRTSLKQGAKAPLLVLPTGAGKTVIFSELAKDFVSQDTKSLKNVFLKERFSFLRKKVLYYSRQKENIFLLKKRKDVSAP